MSAQRESFLPVEAGLFQTKSIVGDGFELRPKGFNPERVYRNHHVTTIMTRLQQMVDKENQDAPGLYVQGPAGVGKSVILYTITQIAKFHLKWLTVYLPNCKEWRQNNNSTRGMAYFLDRVRDAFSVEVMQEIFPEVWKKLNGPIEEKKFDQWVSAALKPEEKQRVMLLFREVMLFLREGSGDTPVLLVLDQVNALDSGLRDLEPWSIMDFDCAMLHRGALLVSGTTDSEFVGTFPAGYDRTCDSIYNLPEFEAEETEHLLNTELGLPLKMIRDFDPKLWHEIADACGNMPGELRGFAKRLRDLSSQIIDDIQEPARKKIKLDICSAINEHKSENRMYHRQLFEKVTKADQKRGKNAFRNNLREWCEKYFLENEPHRSLEILRAPNFVVHGTRMRPTTVDASQAYFDWLVQESRQREPDSLLQNLATICAENSDPNGSTRSHAFERFLSSKLTLCGRQGFRLRYHLLRERQTNWLALHVRNRLFAKADCPPNDFRNYPEGTLLTHTVREGGQARVGMIHYGAKEVVYMEATVGNNRATKLPPAEEEGDRTALILSAVQKWLGKNVYDVEINPDGSGLTVAYTKSYTSRSNATGKPPPQVHYIVVTTCPSSLQPTRELAKRYRWIKVCFLDDLVASGIIPPEKSASILEAQAEDARGGGLLEWLGLKIL